MTTPTVTPTPDQSVSTHATLIIAMKVHNEAMNDCFDGIISKEEYLYIVGWYNRIQAKYRPSWKPFREK